MATNTKQIVPLITRFVKHIKHGSGYDSTAFQKYNAKLVLAENGRCSAEFTVTPEMVNFVNQLHGGYTATMLDACSTLAVISNNKGGAVTLNFQITYLKSALVGDEVIIDARTVRTGKNVAFVEAEARNKKTGDILSTCTQSMYYVLPGKY